MTLGLQNTYAKKDKQLLIFLFVHGRSMIGITLALLSGAVAGLAVVLVRKKSDETNFLNISLMVTLIGNIVLWPLAIVFTNLRTISIEGVLLFALAGALAPGIGRLLYYKGMQTVGASVNASVFAIHPMFSSILAVLLLGETLSPANWLGITSIIIGVIFIQTSSKNDVNHKRNWGKSLFLPVLATLTIAVAQIIRKNGLNIYNEPLLGAAVGYAFSLSLYLLLLSISETWHRSFFPKRDFRLFWKAGLGITLSMILSFYAVSYEEVSIVTPLLAVEPLFVVFFAYLYLKELEQISYKLVLSVILTVSGVALVGI